MKIKTGLGILMMLPFFGISQNQTESSNKQLIKPMICMVTVDGAGTSNEIIWDKKSYPDAEEFLIYIVTPRGQDSLIGTVTADLPGIYTDKNGQAGKSLPTASFQKYKMSYKDKQAKESALSDFHQTIHISGNQKGEFNWNAYVVFPAINPSPKYAFYRKSNTGVVTKILETEKTVAIDPEFEKYKNSNYIWFVELGGLTCASDPSDPTSTKNGTKSNNSNE